MFVIVRLYASCLQVLLKFHFDVDASVKCESAMLGGIFCSCFLFFLQLFAPIDYSDFLHGVVGFDALEVRCIYSKCFSTICVRKIWQHTIIDYIHEVRWVNSRPTTGCFHVPTL